MTRALSRFGDGRAPVRRWPAANTVRAYRSMLDRFGGWLEANARALDDDAVAEYLNEMFEAGLSPRTAGQLISALRYRARLEDGELPVGPNTELALDRFAKLGAGRGRGQASGIRWEDADRMAKAAASDGLVGLRDAAVIATMSDILGRVSEVAAALVEHVAPAQRGGATLLIPRSKTDQTGEGRALYLGAPTVARIEQWREAGEVLDGFLFRRVYRGHVHACGLTPRTIANIIKRRASECGIEHASGHSLRVGSAQSLAADGASLVEMQISGRWIDSRMPAAYARNELAQRGAVARRRYGL